MGLLNQYKALLYKNWILWKRNTLGSMCEILFPAGLMIVIYLLRLASPASREPALTFADESSGSVYLSPDPATYQSQNLSLPFQRCFGTGADGEAFFSYSIISEDQDFKEYMKIGIEKLTSYTVVKPYFRDFASETDLENFITGDSYENSQHICFAVVFNKINGGKYQLSLRFNTTDPVVGGDLRLGQFIDVFRPGSHPPTDPLIVAPNNYVSLFYDFGFLPLNNLADNYILTHILEKTEGIITSEIRPMRFPSYISDDFLGLIGVTLSAFIIISYVIPVCRLLSGIVRDKESKTKEMMMMMGLSSFAYWLSWITYYFIIYTLLAVILTIVAVQGKIFAYSDPGLIFLYFWLFGLSCMTFSIFLSTFFSRSRTAVLIGVPIFLGSYFASFAVSDPTVSQATKVASSLLPTVAFDLATAYLCLVETGEDGVHNGSLGDLQGNYSFSLYFIMICADICYMGLLSVYLDLIWPTEWGVKRHWCFFLTRDFWCPGKTSHNERLFKESIDWGNSVETADPSLETQRASGKALIVRELTKKFGNKIAVDRLNLDMYEGQIFALLGHNGAGKTTTLSMLTGMIPITSGDMLIRGKYLSRHLKEIRSQLGVCPQHDILFADLTPEEHLHIFCMFKGETDKQKIRAMTHKRLAELDLLPSATKPVRLLSGGQKRKLSLAIALIGDSSIILLDEPTSGMDLTARRHVWDILKNNKQGRVIILTTHYMEEADVLADRIAIIAEGKLKCCGSPMFLKTMYGSGYYLTLVASHKAVLMHNLEEIESFVTRSIQDSSLIMNANKSLTFQLPGSQTMKFVRFFKRLDRRLNSLGLESYSISATTLEEVFLKIARGEESSVAIGNTERNIEDNEFFLKRSFTLARERLQGSLFFSHFLALLIKRVRSARRDVRLLVFEIVIPILLVIIGLVLMLLPPLWINYDPYDLTIANYEQVQQILYSGSNSEQLMTKFHDYLVANTGDLTNKAFSDRVFSDRNSIPYHMGAYFFHEADNTSYSYFYSTYVNQTAYQSSPTYYHSMSNAIFQSISPSFSVQVLNHPLPITKKMQNINGLGNGFLGSLVFSLGFSFIPTGIIILISRERESNVKHQHIISGVSLLAYWSSSFVWDMLKHTVPAVTTSLIILAFQIDIYTGDNNNYGGMWMLIVLAGISSAPFSYFLSFFFNNHSKAQVVMLITSVVTGSVFPSAVFALYFFDATRKTARILAWVLKIFPNFCFGWGAMRIGTAPTLAALEQTGVLDAFELESAGGCMLLMGVMTLVYFLLVVFAEIYDTSPKIQKMLALPTTDTTEMYELDKEVETETALAEKTSPFDVPVNVNRLIKVFFPRGRRTIAVNKISFNVNERECFALLGVNGAGKTTTFKILTGQIPSDSGSAYIWGNSISSDLKRCRSLIGYCPQFDALTETLTGREHLELYSTIKGIPRPKITEQIDCILKDIDLEEYADVVAGAYSGGNKRKLSVAIALIGNPAVVFLDEPSAGMDPEARKKLWKVLARVKENDSAVIITTHSMEEAEALCDRMTIMVRGVFKCIGTCAEIKDKFGDTYELEIKFESPSIDEVSEVCDRITKEIGENGKINFGNYKEILRALDLRYLKKLIKPNGPGSGIYLSIDGDGFASKETFAYWCIVENLGYHMMKYLVSQFEDVIVIEHYNLMTKYRLKRYLVRSLGLLFSVIEERRKDMGIADYAITMTSLEQIFNRFAKKASVEELLRMNQENNRESPTKEIRS